MQNIKILVFCLCFAFGTICSLYHKDKKLYLTNLLTNIIGKYYYILIKKKEVF